MSNREIELLSYIKDNWDVLWVDVLNAFNPAENVLCTDASLKQFLKDGLIQITSQPDRPPTCRIRITPKGFDLLSAQVVKQQEAEQPCAIDHATNSTEHQFSKVVKFVFALIAALASLATIATTVLAYVEHFAQ